MPVGSSSASPLFPGQKFEFTFDAESGDRLTLATMFGQSNDIFAGTPDTGLDLFTNDIPLMGDITSMLSLWDAGTEVNEKPGIGLNQAPRQSAPNTGPSENGAVRTVANSGDGFTYAMITDLIKVTIEAN